MLLVISFFFSLQENNSIKWASRWDYILVSMPHTNIQWFRYGVRNKWIVVKVVKHIWEWLPDVMTFARSVQHHELLGHCSLPVGDGCDDHAENLAQGHCQIQPGGPGEVFVFQDTINNSFMTPSCSCIAACLFYLVTMMKFHITCLSRQQSL